VFELFRFVGPAGLDFTQNKKLKQNKTTSHAVQQQSHWESTSVFCCSLCGLCDVFVVFSGLLTKPQKQQHNKTHNKNNTHTTNNTQNNNKQT
jgi:hypothetical protein